TPTSPPPNPTTTDGGNYYERYLARREYTPGNRSQTNHQSFPHNPSPTPPLRPQHHHVQHRQHRDHLRTNHRRQRMIKPNLQSIHPPQSHRDQHQPDPHQRNRRPLVASRRIPRAHPDRNHRPRPDSHSQPSPHVERIRQAPHHVPHLH